MDVCVVNNHGDRKSSPKDRVRVIPLPNELFMAYKWGCLTTYILTGMILQLPPHHDSLPHVYHSRLQGGPLPKPARSMGP